MYCFRFLSLVRILWLWFSTSFASCSAMSSTITTLFNISTPSWQITLCFQEDDRSLRKRNQNIEKNVFGEIRDMDWEFVWLLLKVLRVFLIFYAAASCSHLGNLGMYKIPNCIVLWANVIASISREELRTSTLFGYSY